MLNILFSYNKTSVFQPFGIEGFNISFGIGAFPIGLFAGVS